MKRTVLAATLAITAFVASSSRSDAQIITAGYGTPFYGYGAYPSYGYGNYGYNYGSSFSFGYGNAYRPSYGVNYGSAFVGPRYYGGYNNFNNGYRYNNYGGYNAYRGRGYRR